MNRRGRPTVEITLSAEERATLERWARRHSSSQMLALRSKIVLACAAGGATHAEIAAELARRIRTSQPALRIRASLQRCRYSVAIGRPFRGWNHLSHQTVREAIRNEDVDVASSLEFHALGNCKVHHFDL